MEALGIHLSAFQADALWGAFVLVTVALCFPPARKKRK